MKAAVERQGEANGMAAAECCFLPSDRRFRPERSLAGAGELQQGWTDIPYDLPNLRVENGPAPAHVRIGWLRSVANIYQAFAVQTFTAELAANAGRDHMEYAAGFAWAAAQ